MRKIDLQDRSFGRLLVIAPAKSENRKTKWLCRCECGNEKVVGAGELLAGRSQSCGCLRNELLKLRNAENQTHGLSLHPLYGVWRAMLHRCEDPSDHQYRHYGGRDIKVCERWHDVTLFVKDLEETYRPGLWLDREDNSRDYEPDNCRWATPTEQNRNRRNNHHVTLNGKSVTLAEFEQMTGFRIAYVGGNEPPKLTISAEHPQAGIKGEVSV